MSSWLFRQYPPPILGAMLDLAHDLPDGALLELENLLLDQTGMLTNKNIGMTRITADPIVEGSKVLSAFRYYKTDATAYAVVQVGQKIYSFNLTTGATTDITGALTLAATAFSYAVHDLAGVRTLYMANGKLYKWAGSGNIAQVGTEDFTHICVQLNRLWGVRATNPTYLYFSNEAGETWTATDYTVIADGVGGQPQQLIRVASYVLTLQQESYCLVSGSYLEAISKEYGSTGGWGDTLALMESDSAIWAGSNGVVIFNPNSMVTPQPITDYKIRSALQAHGSTIQSTAIGRYWRAGGVYFLSVPDAVVPRLYMIDCKIEGPGGGKVFPVGWLTPAISAIMPCDGTGDNGYIYFGTKAGRVVRGFYGQQFEGTDVTSKVRWPYSDLGDPINRKSVRRVFVPVEAAASVTVELAGDGGVPITKVVSLAGGEDAFMLDTDYVVASAADADAAYLAEAALGCPKATVLKANAYRWALRLTHTAATVINLMPPVLAFSPKRFGRRG